MPVSTPVGSASVVATTLSVVPWRSHVDPAKVDIHVVVEPCLEAELLEETLCGVLVRHGDGDGRDSRQRGCLCGHEQYTVPESEPHRSRTCHSPHLSGRP